MSKPEDETAVELADSELSEVQGGLLVPAVQKVREAAARLSGLADDDTLAVTPK